MEIRGSVLTVGWAALGSAFQVGDTKGRNRVGAAPGPLSAAAGALEVTLFRREACHLCEMVEEEIRSAEGAGVRLTEVDVDADPTMQHRYGLRVPVVVVGGREVFEAKMMDVEGRWRERLPSLLRGR